MSYIARVEAAPAEDIASPVWWVQHLYPQQQPAAGCCCDCKLAADCRLAGSAAELKIVEMGTLSVAPSTALISSAALPASLQSEQDAAGALLFSGYMLQLLHAQTRHSILHGPAS